MVLVSELSPEDYARRCLDGDREAFAAIYDRYADDVQRVLIAMRVGLDHQQIEDAVQEAFLRLYRALGRLDLEKPLRPYLLRIARNLALDGWRRAGRETPLEGDPIGGEEAAVVAGRAEGSTLIDQAVHALDPSQRSVLALRHEASLTMKELAAVLECSVPTARARLREAALLLGVELRRRGVYPQGHVQ
jgi:RNA polymerase sigma factor (sigma-70 family)